MVRAVRSKTLSKPFIEIKISLKEKHIYCSELDYCYIFRGIVILEVKNINFI